MKKLLSLVLICAMGLGMVSCVESEESPSVEAIRNAKAEQLKALANLYNAQAEAETIFANAEAALMAAEAEYQEALAAAKQAEADAIDAQVKMAQEEFAVTLEQLKAEAEAAIKKAQYKAAEWEQKLLAMAHAEINRLYEVYAAYVDAAAAVNTELVAAKVELVAAEAGLVSKKEGYENTIATNEAEIAKYKAQLAVLEDSEYAAFENEDSLEVEKVKALRAWYEADQAYKANEYAAYEAAKKATAKGVAAFEKAKGKIKDTAMIVAMEDGMYVSVKVSEVGLAYLKANHQPSDSVALAKAVTNAEKAVAKAEANLATAKVAADEWAAAEKANKAALKVLANAWEAYKAAPVDTATAAAKLKDAKALYAADTAALAANKKLLAANESLLPALEALKADIDAAVKAERLAYSTDTAAQNAVTKAQTAMNAIADQTSAEYKVAKAAYEAAVATQKVTAQEHALAQLEVNKADLAYATFAVKAKTDSDINVAIKNAKDAVALYKKAIFDLEVNILNDTEPALAAAQKAFDAAVAKQVDPKAVAEALVNADADVKASIAKLDSLYKAYNYKVLTVTYNHLAGYVAKTGKVTVLADANQDGKPDFINSNTGDVYAEAKKEYYVTVSTTALKQLVADRTNDLNVAKDALTNAQNNLAQAGENVTADEFEASVRAAVEALNAMIPSLNELYTAEAAAKKANDAAYKAVATLKGKYDGFVTIGSTNPINEKVAEINDAIAACEAAIAAAEKSLAEMDDETVSTTLENKLNIETLKAQIAQLEAELAYLNDMVEHSKAELDAAVSAHMGE